MKDLRDYRRPATADEAVALKREFGSTAVYLGGATDLLVGRPAGVEVAIDIRHADIGDARREDDVLVVGGAALLRDAEAAAGTSVSGMLRRSFRETAPWLIRNAATLSGNIANASPSADSVPALMALDAMLVLQGDIREEVAVEDVLVGPHVTSLGDRLIREIRVPVPAIRVGHFTKLARSHSDIALVNLAVAYDRIDGVARNVRIALGSVAPTAIRARSAEAVLEGRQPTPDVLAEVEAAVREGVRPISDFRASEEYRRRMSGVLVRRAIVAAWQTEGNGNEQ
jgi:aerobic carbon-monoxide dehydrogenase medium subunit